jgi:hypothetical protein
MGASSARGGSKPAGTASDASAGFFGALPTALQVGAMFGTRIWRQNCSAISHSSRSSRHDTAGWLAGKILRSHFPLTADKTTWRRYRLQCGPDATHVVDLHQRPLGRDGRLIIR